MCPNNKLLKIYRCSFYISDVFSARSFFTRFIGKNPPHTSYRRSENCARRWMSRYCSFFHFFPCLDSVTLTEISIRDTHWVKKREKKPPHNWKTRWDSIPVNWRLWKLSLCGRRKNHCLLLPFKLLAFLVTPQISQLPVYVKIV